MIDFIRVKNAFGGTSVIGFKSCDQGREKFQGASLDFVWFDEEPPKDIYEECRMRVLDRQGDIFGTMTPLKGLTFVYDEIFMNGRNDPEVWYEFMEWADNPHLPEGEIKLLESCMDEREQQSRRFGRFSSSEGLVYPEFDERVHVIEPFPIPPEWQDNISIDPGLNNPLSAHWYAVDYDDNVYVVYEHFEAGRDVDYHAAEIKRICGLLGWKRITRGGCARSSTAPPNSIPCPASRACAKLFYERDILVNPDVDKDLFSGIARVKSYLRRDNGLPDLYIFSGCVHLIRELKGYFWGSGDVPKKADDHALDELRYYLMSRPKKMPPEPEKTAVQKDKERKWRRLANARRRTEH